MKYNKPYIFLWITALIILISGGILFFVKGNIAFNLNLFDTYYVVLNIYLTLFLAFICFLTGAGYKYMDDAGKAPAGSLTKIHVFTTEISAVLCWITAFTLGSKPLAEGSNLPLVFLGFLILLLAIQILYFVNLIRSAVN
ncbi:MAG: hypothetical protein EOO89_23165 [Pedobacter sp.]|nr:MAG: hypothetical protein EOO89_23165 [Pedobacter sp.]